jgi:competence protein ComEC
MVKTAIAFMVGCVLFMQLSELPHSLWFCALLPALIFLRYSQTRLVGVFIIGLLWTFVQANVFIKDRLNPELEGHDIAITGIVSNIPERNSNVLRFEFQPDNNSLIPLPNTIRLSWYKPLPKQLKAGERWQLTVRLKQIHGMANPGGFDYEAWLFQQGIGATGYIRTTSSNTKIASSAHYSINALRQSLLKKLQQHLETSPNLGLIEGLTTGIRNNISKQQWNTLRASGTSHLLAISGLHIGLAATIGFFCFRWLWSLRAKNLLLIPATEFAAVGGFFVALFYAAMAGFSIPTQRALIMVSVLFIGILYRRPIASSSLLAFSLLIILILDPFAVLSAGFWLSFSAVALILFVSQNRSPSPRWQWLKIHSLIAFGLTPFLLFFFFQTSLIAPVANLIAIPFISFIIVPLLLLSSLLLALFEPLGELLLQLSDRLLSLFWPVLDYLASIPYANYNITPLPFYYYLPILLGTVILLAPRGFPAKWVGIIGFSPLFLFSAPKPDNGEFWFDLLDVGQGLAAVVQTRNHALVFDTGPKFSDSFNAGTAIVAPFLKQQGINKIDTLVISHGDNDHIGGAVPLIKTMPVETIITSVPEKLPGSRPCYADSAWDWDGIQFELLYPQSNDVSSENNLSCVLKITNQQGSLLLTGDIEQLAERRLVHRYGQALQSAVLIAPHHGSKTSSSLPFINAINPQIVLFPVGYRNRYHFPHADIIKRYSTHYIETFNSAEHGAINIKFNLDSISLPSSWRHNTQKIWSAHN